MDTLLDQVDFEYEKFFLDMMRTSKENIFTKCQEIQMKREIREYLKKRVPRYSEKEIELMLGLDNIFESAYRYMQDYNGKETSAALKLWEKEIFKS